MPEEVDSTAVAGVTSVMRPMTGVTRRLSEARNLSSSVLPLCPQT